MKIAIDHTLLLNQIYDNVRDFAIFTVDCDGKITSWNAGAELIFGYSADDAAGQDIAILFTVEDRQLGQPEKERRTAAQHGRAADYRWHVRKDGARFWADGVMTPLRGDADSIVGYLKIARDITDRKLAQDEISRLATVDALTGLANRVAFQSHRSEMLALALRTDQLLLLLLIDLDHFKEVNDTYGHHAGDLLLQQAAQRIRGASRGSDFVARLGGDEFALLQLNAQAPTDGATLADKLLATLSRPFTIEQREVQISASIGIAICPVDTREAEDLLKKADMAMYQAKSKGRNNFHYFTEALDQAAHRRNADHAELRRVTDARSFWLEYQPIVEAHGGQTIAMEALLRFPGPVLSAYPVDYVIGLAQETGLIPEIGAWVFRQACLQLQQWKAAGLHGLKICINTCAKELLEPAYLSALHSAVAECHLLPGDIVVELTERDAIELEQTGSQVTHSLRSSGFSLSLDDFGTGYSSLSYLRSLPVTSLKLDKSFLRGVPNVSNANAVAKAVVNLAHDLGLTIVAEGVENRDQEQFLASLHCTAYQGYLYAPALPPDVASAWLQSHASVSV